MGKEELEELRRIQEAKRAAQKEDIEEEKKAVADKKAAFLSRAAAFEKKKEPSQEEVRAQIQKESGSRKFNRILTKTLKSESGEGLRTPPPPGSAPPPPPQKKQTSAPPPPPTPPPPPPVKLLIPTKVTPEPEPEPELEPEQCKPEPSQVESELRSSSNESSCPWQFIPASGGQDAYFWNSTTGESTYDPPSDFPLESLPESFLSQTNDSTFATPTCVWQKVDPTDEQSLYYWNSETGESTYEEPPEYREYLQLLGGGGGGGGVEGGSGVIYQVIEDESSGLTYYRNLSQPPAEGEEEHLLTSPPTHSTPLTTLIVIPQEGEGEGEGDHTGGETVWMEVRTEDGEAYYQTIGKGEGFQSNSSWERPQGGSMLLLDSIALQYYY